VRQTVAGAARYTSSEKEGADTVEYPNIEK